MKKTANKLLINVLTSLILAFGSFFNAHALSKTSTMVVSRGIEVTQLNNTIRNIEILNIVTATGNQGDVGGDRLFEIGHNFEQIYIHNINSSTTPLLAFPECQGYGCATPGGRGGRIIFVTNLNDNGTGSLRDALSQTGARIIVFRVGGIITAASPVYIYSPYITIMGQTAPGDGIILKGSPLFVRTHDVIVRGMKFRPGDGSVGAASQDRDGITLWGSNIYPVYNVVIDHNSIEWGVDENISTWADNVGSVHDVTISYNISAEALNCSIHVSEGTTSRDCHSMGMLVGNTTDNLSVHHNLLAFNNDRNPGLFGGNNQEYVNNVIYGWGQKALNFKSGATFANVIGNYCKATSNSQSWVGGIKCFQYEAANTSRLYFSGNISPGRDIDTIDEWAGVALLSPSMQSTIRQNTPVFSGMVTATDALTAYNAVLGHAGAIRDATDNRIVSNVRNNLPPAPGKWLIDSLANIGGYPAYTAGTSPPDTDGDGLPDSFETVDISPLGYAPSGYQWIEEYANALFFSTPPLPITPTLPAPPTPTATSTSVPVTATSSPTPLGTQTVIPWTATPTGIMSTATVITPTPLPQTPMITPTSTANPPTLPSGISALTSVDPDSLLVGETGLVAVSLNGLPSEGVASIEFTCSYASDQISVGNVQIGEIFGDDPVSAYNNSQTGSFIYVVAASNGKALNTNGMAFTFNITGLQPGSSSVECKAKILRANYSMESIASVPDSLTIILFSAPTATPLSAPMLTGQVIAKKPVTISLLNPDTSLAATAITNPDGSFNLIAPAGTFTVVASAEGHLNAQASVTLLEGTTTTLDPITLPAGDIDSNNVIDQYDALTVGMNYNISASLPADLSNDGLVNAVDLVMLAENYRMTGLLTWQQP